MFSFSRTCAPGPDRNQPTPVTFESDLGMHTHKCVELSLVCDWLARWRLTQMRYTHRRLAYYLNSRSIVCVSKNRDVMNFQIYCPIIPIGKKHQIADYSAFVECTMIIPTALDVAYNELSASMCNIAVRRVTRIFVRVLFFLLRAKFEHFGKYK